ncbi:hypothetical protein [Sorangium sp. So ce388]|uniref:hypothetical protein n=1 Tax=Sorangium sp. So ce388 TaxID=3133309 RepID=UPI003F5AEBB7
MGRSPDGTEATGKLELRGGGAALRVSGACARGVPPVVSGHEEARLDPEGKRSLAARLRAAHGT